MIRLDFKLSPLGLVELELAAPLTLAEVLATAAARQKKEVGATMVVRSGCLLRQDELVADGDLLEIYPALSGG